MIQSQAVCAREQAHLTHLRSPDMRAYAKELKVNYIQYPLYE